MTWPGAPRRPALYPAAPAPARHRAPEPPLPAGWRRVTDEAPPASWSGLPRPIRARPPTSAPPSMPLPTPAPVPDHQPGAARVQLSKNAKAIVAAIGGALTVLAMIDGLGFIPADARDIFAVLTAAATPIVIFFIPDWKPPGGNDGNSNPPHAAS